MIMNPQLFSLEWLRQVLSNCYSLLFGMVTSILGYFLPIRNIVQVVLLFFIIDILFGYWAAIKLRSERFSVKIIWNHTIPRMVLSIILILLAFIWDTTFSQGIISTYNLFGWFISGVLIYSIAENGYLITNWGVFNKIKGSFSDKVNKETDITIK